MFIDFASRSGSAARIVLVLPASRTAVISLGGLSGFENLYLHVFRLRLIVFRSVLSCYFDDCDK